MSVFPATLQSQKGLVHEVTTAASGGHFQESRRRSGIALPMSSIIANNRSLRGRSTNATLQRPFAHGDSMVERNTGDDRAEGHGRGRLSQLHLVARKIEVT